jgi:hypothetical protein
MFRFHSRVLCAGSIAFVIFLAQQGVTAQGLYYKEIRKDGRIYVFNIAANADKFEKAGELPAGITRAGAGPNGETVFADN